MLYRNILIFLLFITQLSLSAQDLNTIPAKKSPISIDGTTKDWGELRYYDHTTRLKYGLCNDEQYLYMVFQSDNSVIQMKTIIAGITIKFKTKVKPKITAEFTFPKPKEDQSIKGLEKTMGGPSLELNKEKKDLEKSSMILTGFAYSNGEIPITIDTTFKAFLTWDSTALMVYELRIPLKELFHDQFDLEKISSKDLKMILDVNSLSRPSVSAQNRGRGNNVNNAYSSNPATSMGGMYPNGNNMGGGQTQQVGGPLFTAQRLTHPFKLNPSVSR